APVLGELGFESGRQVGVFPFELPPHPVPVSPQRAASRPKGRGLEVAERPHPGVEQVEQLAEVARAEERGWVRKSQGLLDLVIVDEDERLQFPPLPRPRMQRSKEPEVAEQIVESVHAMEQGLHGPRPEKTRERPCGLLSAQHDPAIRHPHRSASPACEGRLEASVAGRETAFEVAPSAFAETISSKIGDRVSKTTENEKFSRQILRLCRPIRRAHSRSATRRPTASVSSSTAA